MLYLRIHYQIQSQIFTPMFSKIFMVLTLRLFIHFESIFVYSVQLGFSFVKTIKLCFGFLKKI